MTTVEGKRKTDIGLLAHLYRRAGFGATREQLERYAERSYEETVEFLLNPNPSVDIPEDEINRYFTGEGQPIYVATWLYRMLNSKCQLQEKMTLFWHGVFATGIAKNEHLLASREQIGMLRRVGMSDMGTILLELSRDPAMIFWLDNNENHNGEPNENYGRELLELFSLGVGNYTEQDIKNAARAFTGWTFAQPPPLYPQGFYPAPFVFRADDHDYGEKTFLGETGPLDGGRGRRKLHDVCSGQRVVPGAGLPERGDPPRAAPVRATAKVANTAPGVAVFLRAYPSPSY